MTADRLQEIQAQKKRIRRQISEKEQSLDPIYKESSNRKIQEELLNLPEYRKAKTVFCFVGRENEIATTLFLKQALSDGKRLAVPLCVGKGIMEARQIHSMDDLEPGMLGIMEPKKETAGIRPEEINLAVIPCCSAARNGVRLGYGGGFYDRYFSASEAAGIDCILICREHLLSEDLPEDEWDLRFPRVLTENGICQLC